MEELIKRITAAAGQRFSTFGGGGDPLADSNPIAAAFNDRPLQFALGTSVEEVVRFVLQEAAK